MPKILEDILPGTVYTNLKVVSKSDIMDKWGKIQYNCQCSCDGKIILASGTQLRHGRIKSCGCLHMLDDIPIGTVFTNLTVKSKSEMRKNGYVSYNCQCACDGKIILVAGSQLLNGRRTSCGCLQGGPLEEGEASFNALFYDYKKDARERNHTFNITKDQFRNFTKRNCTYCNKSPSQIFHINGCNGDYVYTGIDRSDNNVGYELKNCVPCCKDCNRAKMEKSEKEFCDWVKNIYNISILKNKSDPVSITKTASEQSSVAFNNILCTYKYRAVEKNRIFNLMDEQIENLFSMNCFYCGKEPSNVHNVNNHICIHSGIDRVDNCKGYELNNCVSCCKDCNYAKGTMTQDNFYKHAEEIYNYWALSYQEKMMINMS